MRTSSRWSSSYTNFPKKNKWPEGSICFGAFFKKLQKSKIWIHRNGITSFFGKLFKNCAFLGPVTSIKKKRQIILTLRSSCFLWFFFVEQTSITFKGWKVKDLRHLLTNHHNFFSESSFGIYIHVSKKNQLHQPGKPREHRLGEVLQRRSKSKLYIISVLFF